MESAGFVPTLPANLVNATAEGGNELNCKDRHHEVDRGNSQNHGPKDSSQCSDGVNTVNEEKVREHVNEKGLEFVHFSTVFLISLRQVWLTQRGRGIPFRFQLGAQGPI